MKRVTNTRTLSVCLEPIPGESLNGFVARSFAISPIRNRHTALAFAGIHQHDTNLQAALQSEGAAENLGTLLGCKPDLLVLMSLPERSDLLLRKRRNFYGSWINRELLAVERRRVSPRALSIKSFHRATWMLLMFKLDAETLEPLIDTCPVCGIVLGWRRSVAAHHCDHCLAADGRPSVDLRDFTLPAHELADAQGYRFLHDLVSPTTFDTRPRCLDPAWEGVRPATLFELGFQLAKLLGASMKVAHGSFSERIMKLFDPEVVDQSGCFVLEGRVGLQKAEDLLSNRHGEAFLRDAIGADPRISSSVRQLAETVLGAPRPDHKAYQSPLWLQTHYGIPKDVLVRFAGRDGATIGKGRRSRFDRKEIESIAPQFHDAIDATRAIAILGILPRDIATLLRMNFIKRPSPQVRSLMPGAGDYVCGSDVANLLGTLEDRALDYAAHVMSLREFFRTRTYACTLGIVLAAVQSRRVHLLRIHSKSACWADRFGSSNWAELDRQCSAIIATYPQAVRGILPAN